MAFPSFIVPKKALHFNAFIVLNFIFDTEQEINHPAAENYRVVDFYMTAAA
jgi:hypothetical protein